MHSVPTKEETKEFSLLLKIINAYLKFLLRSKPIIRNEWDIDDFSQELALKYFKNIIKIDINLKSYNHRLYLFKKMAKQVLTDKIRTMQRAKRDVKKKANLEIDFVDKKSTEPMKYIFIQEELNKIKSKISKEIWKVLEWRSQGKTWDKCSSDIGSVSTAALRLKVKRHLNLVKACG
jgi:hypothetical protein